MKKILYFACVLLTCTCVACSSSDDEEGAKEKTTIIPLPAIKDISLNYNASNESVTLSRDVQSEGAKARLKGGVSWINNLNLNGRNITFNVEENNNVNVGHRYDTIMIEVQGLCIGKICVTQARNPFSSTRLAWANESAMYRHKALSQTDLSGLEMTKLVYNLEKSTGGKDSYKNYPAFAFCIEMNHDPEHNMEWYLPSEEELFSYGYASQSFKGTPLARHNYWWSSSENSLTGSAYNVDASNYASRGAVSKSGEWWVVAFRNGKIEE